jgi:predicted DNA-binding transcriptional regulator AlpA
VRRGEGEPAVSDSDAPAIPHIRPVVRFDQVIEITGHSRATINRLVNSDPDFPKPHRFGKFSAVFYADEFANYMNNLKPTADAPVHHGGKVHLHKKPKGTPKSKLRARRVA